MPNDVLTLTREPVVVRDPWREQGVDWWLAIRPRDLLVLRIGLKGIDHDALHGILRPAGAGAFLILELPSQALGEAAFRMADLAKRDAASPVSARRAGPSRLVYRLTQPIPFTLDEILRSPARVPVIATEISATPVPADLLPTYLEAPYRMFLSPEEGARWISTTPPPGKAQPIWQMWLDRAPGSKEPPRLFALTSRPEMTAASRSDDPFTLSVDKNSRLELERRLGAWPNAHERGVQAKRVALSALGADLSLAGNWSLVAGDQGALTSWRHDAVLGRDVRVELVRQAFLFPFGHRVSYVQLTERRFVQAYSPEGRAPHPERLAAVAYLEQRFFLVRIDEVMTYDGPTSNRAPFRSVRLITEQSPNIHPAPSTNKGEGFWPKLDRDGAPLLHLELEGTDREGRTVRFHHPCVIVFGERPATPVDEVFRKARVTYGTLDANQQAHPERAPMIDLGGREVAIHQPLRPGDTTVHVASISFDAEEDDYRIPRLARASVEHVAVAGLGAKTPLLIELKIKPPALHPANLFATLAPEASSPLLSIGDQLKSRAAAALAQPVAEIRGLSTTLGAVGGRLDAFDLGEFDPRAYFANVQGQLPTLLGVLPLADLLSKFKLPPGLEGVPKLVRDGYKSCYHWTTQKLDPKPDFGFEPEHDATFRVESCVEVSFGGPPKISTTTSLTRFKLALPPKSPLAKILFDRIEVRAVSGEEPKLTVELRKPMPISFEPPLDFIYPLVTYLQDLLGGKGLNIQLTSDKLSALTRFGLPSIGIGVFSLRNLALELGLDIPFGGTSPKVRFSVCSHRRPFQLQVGVFGGGGFFGFELGLTGTAPRLEGALEFGAMAALDLGVATGNVYLVAGIWYAGAGDSFILTGYIRCGGNLDVLGLVSITVEFYLALTYADGALSGEARMTVEISMLFFSVTVELRVQRRLAGRSPSPMAGELPGTIVASDEPPRFDEVFDLGAWRHYWGAFIPQEA